MKKIALLCAVGTLAACSEAETTTEAEPTEAAAEAPAASWALEAGTYEYTRSDGVSGVNTVAADGTYSNDVEGGEIETGTWGQEGEMSCFVPEEGDKRCYTFTPPDADGNLTGTREDGPSVEVRKVA